jgi:hypothetical protein
MIRVLEFMDVPILFLSKLFEGIRLLLIITIMLLDIIADPFPF